MPPTALSAARRASPPPLILALVHVRLRPKPLRRPPPLRSSTNPAIPPACAPSPSVTPRPTSTFPGSLAGTHKLSDFAGPTSSMALFDVQPLPHFPTASSSASRSSRDDRARPAVRRCRSQPQPPRRPQHRRTRPPRAGFNELPLRRHEALRQEPRLDPDLVRRRQATHRPAPTAASLTPRRFFIFDKARRLRYAGRFDRLPVSRARKEPCQIPRTPARPTSSPSSTASPVPVELTKTHGCSTKWREKKPPA